MSSFRDHALPPPHHHTHASPLRRMRPPTHAPTTPATPATTAIKKLREERALHQPSPNRTEAAAAMMHLFTSSTSDKTETEKALQGMRLPAHPPVPGVKAKRKYVRKAPRKPSSAAQKMAKITEDSKEDGEIDEIKRESTSADGLDRTSLDGGRDEDMNGPSDQQSGIANEIDADGGFAPFREYNRKEKSLGLLCENFLKLYRSDQVTEICLDRAATELGVERRRIYDIVNILESIHLVSRKSKNLYNWHGLGALAVSTSAMRKKYAEMLLQEGAGANSYDYNFKDRRRGKSLSKLSQMFVQLFLKKDHCIIPLDQAAKQLIQMEDSENEEDRQLKTKIRRLYDVANVLVSVGLIEKMQLSNSRKPVFRWKYRGDSVEPHAAQMGATAHDAYDMHLVRQRVDSVSMEPTIKVEPPSYEVSRNSSMDESDPMKTSQSCDSDNGSDSSESPTESGSGPTTKRKPASRPTPSARDESSAKRSRTAATPSQPPPSTSTPSLFQHPEPSTATGSPNETTSGLLRFNKNNVPIHPQMIYQEQQVQVRQFMERYIHEYIDYIILQQVRQDPLSLEGTSGGTPSLSGLAMPGAAGGRLSAKDVAASMAQDIHRTPMSIPSIMNRVSGELAGSIHDILFSTNSTSPQSVADLLPIDTRNVTKSLQNVALTTSPLPSVSASQHHVPSSSAAAVSTTTSAFAAGNKKPNLMVDTSSTMPELSSKAAPREKMAVDMVSSPRGSVSSPASSLSSSSSASPSSSSEDEENKLQARRLFKAFQPPMRMATTSAGMGNLASQPTETPP